MPLLPLLPLLPPAADGAAAAAEGANAACSRSSGAVRAVTWARTSMVRGPSLRSSRSSRRMSGGEQGVSLVFPPFRLPRRFHCRRASHCVRGTVGRRAAVAAMASGGASGSLERGAAPPAGGFPVVVVFHPTTKSQAKEPAGIEVERPDRVHGLQLIARGYAVWCPRCYIFDEGADYKGNVAKVLARHPDWLGMTRLLYDAVRAADFVESRPEVNKERMGCFGHSLGAKEALYAAAFDLRYKAAVFSEGGIGLSFSNWEAVWYLGEGIKKPGFGLDHHQLMALIAPRGFLILAGNSADDDRCWAYVDAVRPLYKQLGASDKIGWYNHELGHTYPPDAQRVAEEFLERCLKLN